MGGGLLQLIAYGAQDVYLTGNPQITFFKIVYRRHTNFSMECIKQNINGHSEIGITDVNNKGTVTISKTGDLLTSLYVKCDQNVSQGIRGDHLIEDVEVEIGGQRIDKHYREWNQIWSELTIPKSKQEGFQYLTGSFNNNNLPTSKQQSIMYPLNFWFCRNPGLALPLIALQYHDVQLKITWGTAKYDSTSNENLTRINTSSPVTIPVEIWGDYIYLDTDERRRFAQVSHEYLIEQVQIQKEKDDNKLVYTLNLEHPVKELIWTNPSSNSMTNQKAKIEINGHERFSEQSKEYFQIKQPYQHHTSIPGYNIKEKEGSSLIYNPLVSIIYKTKALGTSSIGLAAGDCRFGYFDTSNDVVTSGNGLKTLILRDDSPIDFYEGDIIQLRINNSTNGISTTQLVSISKIRTLTISEVKYTELTFDRDPLIKVPTPGSAAPTSGLVLTDNDGLLLTVIARAQDPQSNCSQLKKDINVYSFALEPEEHQPSGTCNFSKVESALLIFSSTTYISNIYALNYNVFRIMSGMGGLAYSN